VSWILPFVERKREREKERGLGIGNPLHVSVLDTNYVLILNTCMTYDL